MKIEKNVSIVVKDVDDKVIDKNDVIVFRVNGKDHIGNFLGLDGGKIVIGNVTNDCTYKYLPKSIEMLKLW